MTNDGKKQRRLGRGLSALMQTGVPVEVSPGTEQHYRTFDISAPTPAPSQAQVEPEQVVVSIRLASIRPSPFQPRTSFDPGELSGLAESIRQAGVIQPILVRRGSEAGVYELVAGERRWRAAELVGLESIPALVLTLGDEEAAEWALVENVQRVDLNPMERARALKMLSERFGLTHGRIAERVGLERSSVANLIRLTELEEEVQELISSGRLGAGHGKALLGLEAGERRVRMALRAAEEEWAVRRLEASVRRDAAAPEKQTRSAPTALADLERRLGEHLGTRVHITTARDGTRGRIAIEFYSLDHFDGLMSKMQFDGAGY
ncbi:MAG: ParB/RepB/Spo0J family partition protein [Leptolyngbya sp. PLA3]|nr:MAG: ParB/RepB/Spo0J family partition protein [Cyanobacteria bacterium CYA]MCE7967466.1 ParB/RepB/Spo0J family partition protein [Leptolyngbya sp. PL-A3]